MNHIYRTRAMRKTWCENSKPGDTFSTRVSDGNACGQCVGLYLCPAALHSAGKEVACLVCGNSVCHPCHEDKGEDGAWHYPVWPTPPQPGQEE